VKALILGAMLGGLVVLFLVSGYWRVEKAKSGKEGAFCLYLRGIPGN
jgi:hypothetical protein